MMERYKKYFKEYEEAKRCVKYDSFTGNCKTGCNVEKVKQGTQCPYGISDQHNCTCYIG